MKEHSKAAYIQKAWHFTDLQPWKQLQTELEKKKGLLMRTTEEGNGSLRPRSSTQHLLDGGAASRKLKAIMSLSIGRIGACARRIILASGWNLNMLAMQSWFFRGTVPPPPRMAPSLFLLGSPEEHAVLTGSRITLIFTLWNFCLMGLNKQADYVSRRKWFPRSLDYSWQQKPSNIFFNRFAVVLGFDTFKRDTAENMKGYSFVCTEIWSKYILGFFLALSKGSV